MGLIPAETRWKSAILTKIRTLEAQKMMEKSKNNFLASLGFDLGTPGLQNQSSTTELQRLINVKGTYLLKYWFLKLFTFLDKDL